MPKSSHLALFTSLLALSLPLSAKSSPSCDPTAAPYRATARHIEGKGIGYTKGYTSVDFFIAPPSTSHWVPFLDTRLHVFDQGRIATNAGVGLRYLASSVVYGINSYYDYRNTSRQNYNQYSLGFEALGKVWDFRLNGYLPVGAKRSTYYNTQFGYFSGYNMHVQTTQQFDMPGVNFEAGIHIDTLKSVRFYGAFGPYYFGKAGKNAVGGKLRLAATFFDYIKVEGSTSYDPVFHWIGQGELSFNIPFGPRKKIQTNNCSKGLRMRARALQPVDRQEIIVVDSKDYFPLALNPATGLPWKFVFVNNTSHSAGTFNSPFPTLAQAESFSQSGDIIYVFPGDGTDNGMNQGITLQANQKLFGSGIINPIATNWGTISIPEQSNTYPLITNTSGAIVTLSDNCEVAGLNLSTTNAVSYGILGGAVGNFSGTPSVIQSVANPFLRQNIINTPNASQAPIVLCCNNASLSYNQVYATTTADVGIFVGSSDSLTATLIGNTATGANLHGIYLYAAGSITGTTLTGNTGTGGSGGYGIYLFADTGSITGTTLTGNTGTAGSAGTGIYLQANTSITGTTLTGNTGTGSDGIYLYANTSITETTLTGNQGTGGSGGNGIHLYADTSITGATLTGNQGTGGDGGNGIYLFANTGSITGTTLTGNTGTGTSGYGIYLYATTSITEATLTGNQGTAGTNGNGIFLYAVTGSITEATLTGNTGTAAGINGNGILLYADTSITGTTLTGNTGTAAGTNGNGIFLYAVTGSITGTTLTENTGTATGTNSHGLILEATSSIADTTLQGNVATASGSGSSGFAIEAPTITGTTLLGN